MPIKFTQRDIDAIAAPSSGSVFVRDCECTGLVVRAQAKTTRSPQGRRTYLFVWSQGGVEKRVGIGRSCDYTVAEARTRTRELRQAVNRGEDPRRDRRAKRERKTVADLIARYERDHNSSAISGRFRYQPARSA
jgi:hypothetical protein